MLVLALAVAAAAGWWAWNANRALTPAPPAAAQWYQRGVEAIREGAYHSGQRALEEALRLFPAYPIAHARLAEALAELDDERGAQAELLRLSSVLPDESRLPEDDRLRLQGTRALVLRDLDSAAESFRRLAERHAGDATAWLDLGRVQEAAGRRIDARSSYLKSIAIDPQYAAARLRLGRVEGLQSRREEALAAFAESERLYRLAANTEGEAEVLLQRGEFHYNMGDPRQARADLERALGLASTLKGTHQSVRAQMGLSGVTAAEGRFVESERIASAAVQEALDKGLDTVAADGLLDLTATLMESGRLAEAAAQGERAIQLAERRGAKRTAAQGENPARRSTARGGPAQRRTRPRGRCGLVSEAEQLPPARALRTVRHVASVPTTRRSRSGPRDVGRRRRRSGGDPRRRAGGHRALEPGECGDGAGPVPAGPRPPGARGGDPAAPERRVRAALRPGQPRGPPDSPGALR